MKKITPFLWFDNQAEEAVNFYTSIFDNSEILSVNRYGEAGPGEAGSVMTIAFRLADQEFVALNGGPIYHFTPAISLSVDCKNQAEVDRLWERLTADGGTPVQCGWLTDKYGLSWQIIPTRLIELISDPDQDKAKRAMAAMMQMVKIDLAAIEAAYRGETVA